MLIFLFDRIDLLNMPWMPSHLLMSVIMLDSVFLVTFLEQNKMELMWNILFASERV